MAASIGRMIEIFELPEVRELYTSTIREMQPIELVRRLESEKVSTNGQMPELRGRLLRLEIRKMQPKLDVPWYPEDDVLAECRKTTTDKSDLGDASTTKATITQSARNTCKLPIGKENDTLANVSKQSDPMKLGDPISTEKTLDNDATEKKRIDYLLSCMKLLNSWNLQYSGEIGQSARDFLQALTNFRKFSGISDQMLLLMLPSVLRGEAIFWYYSRIVKSWYELENAFNQRVNVATLTSTRCHPPPRYF